MKISLPLYCEKQPGEKGAPVSYLARPLFFLQPEQRREDLPRAVNALTARLREQLQTLAAEAWHESLVDWSFSPPLHEARLAITLEHRKRTRPLEFLLVSYEHRDLRICFTPKLPSLQFALMRGEKVEDRAAEVLSLYFKKLEREEGEDCPDPELFAIKGTAWLSNAELRIDTDLVWKPAQEKRQAARGEFTMQGGLEELARVGRSLDALFPEEITRAVQRETEVNELARAVDASEHRPVLLLGPRGSGKSAIILEYVARSCEARRSGKVSQAGAWLLNPQRLISGMSVVGQWENRLHAIINVAKDRKLVLCFDDLVGLFKAGQTSQSKLSVAQVLKPHLEKREVRVIAEITPEQFRVLQELDRGFADLFHIIPVREPGAEGNLSILIEVMRQLEQQQGCRFDPKVIPAVVELQARYVRDQSFPGKAASMLRQLATRYRGADIGRAQVLDEFRATSGLSVAFLDERVKLERGDILGSLKADVIGQDAAVELLANRVMLAKARLNDPGRPLGSFLFLGPTGVGKTQAAKSIAKYLFGDAARLLRFDMNEFVSPYSVSRLVGTFHEPEGLLTGAVRRQPFCVILFDEIEKCHPDAYDLLLQVLGEARLTDGLGRTSDFSNTLIILTSNLGVREADGGVGFSGHDQRGAPAYIKAAQRFFRPEFFNRLDHIVPFGRLPRSEIERIVHLLIKGVFAREGLSRRKCVLRIDDTALARVVEQGYHPKLGARALKRAIERQVTQPLAASLARLKPTTPTLVTLMPQGEGVQAHLRALTDAQPPKNSIAALGEIAAADALELIDAALDAARSALDELRPKGAVSGSKVEASVLAYYAIKTQVEKVERLANRISRGLDEDTKDHPRRPHRPGRARRDRIEFAGRRVWNDFCSAADVRDFLQNAQEERVSGEAPDTARLRTPLCEAALLQLLVRRRHAPESRVLLVFEALNGAPASPLPLLVPGELQLFQQAFDLAAEEVALGQRKRGLLVQGALARDIATLEAGIHLYLVDHELAPVQVSAVVLKPFESASDAAARLEKTRKKWARQVALGKAGPADEPNAPGQVLRVNHANGLTIDLRSGSATRTEPGIGARRSYLLALLPLGTDEEE